MIIRVLIVVAALLAAAAAIYFTGDRGAAPLSSSAQTSDSSESNSDLTSASQVQQNPKPLSDTSQTAIVATDAEDPVVAEQTAASSGASPSSLDSESGLRSGAGADELGLDIFSIGSTRWTSDEQFEQLAQQLADNPRFRAELLEQFRYESDPQRLKRLAHLLGQTDDPLIASVASEMVFSGNAELQTAALDLLRQVQDKNPEARNVLIDILAAESDPAVLSVALNAVSTPGSADAGQRQTVMANASSLSRHDDPIIRARSISVLSNWADTEQVTPMILQGLSDTDPRVRQTAAYSLVDYAFADAQVLDTLLNVAENSDEGKRTRRGAMLALQGMPLSAEQTQRLESARRDVDRVR